MLSSAGLDLRPLRAAIIDLDGTMVDTLGDFEVALNRTFADLTLPGVNRAAVERTVGKGSEHLIRSLLAEQVPSGAYADEADYLRDLVRRDREAQASARLRELIAEGLASGPATPLTDADVARIRARVFAAGK